MVHDNDLVSNEIEAFDLESRSISVLDKFNLDDLKFFLNQIIKEMTSLTSLSPNDRTSLAETYREIEVLLASYSENIDLSLESSTAAFDDHYEESQTQIKIQALKEICQTYKNLDNFLLLNKWLLAITHWRIRKGGLISQLELVVNSIAEVANNLREQNDLIDYVDYIQDISLAVTKDYYDDMSNSDPNRPWRVLLLNYAIVATRTHQVSNIETVYQFFIEHLPEDAAQFFTEAMSQMVAQNYPEEVRQVVEQFYQQYTVDQNYKKRVH